MKELEFGDEVLVKMTVVGSSLEEGDVYLEYSAHTGNRVDPCMNWVNIDLVVENLGKPQPAEPGKRGAIVSASGLGQNIPVRFVRTEYNPDYPWSPLGPQRGPGPFTWGHITGPEGTRNRTIVVEFEGLD